MKTYVINLKSIVKSVFMTAAVAAVAVLIILSGFSTKLLEEWILKRENLIVSFPSFSSVYNTQKEKNHKLIKFLINEELNNPDKVICGNFPVFSAIKTMLAEMYSDVYESNSYYKPQVKKEELILPETDIPKNVYKAIETTNRSVIPNGSFLEQRGITVKNHTSYTPDIMSLYNKPLSAEYTKENINILIVHTHGTESFNPLDRDENINNNIVKVGTEMAEVFRKNKINVIHSKTMHDIPRFNSSYRKSLNTINEELKKNPEINIVLDVHRDAMISENGDSYKVVCEYNGEKIAQVMFVVGTDGNGLSHPNWKDNLALAIKFQEAMNNKCPDFARPIDLRKERFNQQATKGSLIIEIGTNGNTLNEAIKSGVLAAEVMSEVINSL